VVTARRAWHRPDDPVADLLTPREHEVLRLMAQGCSNGAIAATVHVTYGAVEKHVASIFTKLGIGPDATQHRRVVAVLRYLAATGAAPALGPGAAPVSVARAGRTVLAERRPA
jgi:DNA-binding NarL/FixJ family response regulator